MYTLMMTSNKIKYIAYIRVLNKKL